MIKQEADNGSTLPIQPDQDAAARQCEQLMRLLLSLSPESRHTVMHFAQQASAREAATQNQHPSENEPKGLKEKMAREKVVREKVVRVSNDESGNTFQTIETLAGLRPGQRLDALQRLWRLACSGS